ncbi:serine O-acetyltransferase [Bacillus salipaludis]|uniref:Serine acetyltransferase n=1 Tax=Bacillus salipaludis TaxID=2547811 RepID=A0AA90TSB6_9BACI|nr:serine acetyltransferase [Bacillus salipaludis]MDQ6595004.1 serine acetyltransferase [Bacillus salipaludis]
MENLKRDIKVNKFSDPTKACLFITYRLGNWVYYNLKIPLFRELVLFIYKILDLIFIRIINNAQIPARAKIGGGLRLPHGGNGIIIHPNAEIGENCTIFHQVTIGYKDSPTKSYGPPILKNSVYVGAGAKILGDIIIEDESIIGANAVVVKNVPLKSTAVGIPAQIIKQAKK